MSDLLVVIDAANQGRFEKLTLHRMPGALPFAGRYRLIDFALSNVRNAGIINVAIFPFGNYRSLQDHIGSGKRWNLDRRRDGLFLLPPKNMMLPSDDMLTLQRMHEHIEYFKRSAQSYVLLTPANIVWNIDLNWALQQHIESGADISEIMQDKIRLQTYIIERQALLELILNYDMIPYKTLNDVFLKKNTIKTKAIKYHGYAKRINDPATYIRANLDMLDLSIRRKVFREKYPVYSKEKTAPPARYIGEPLLKNSLVSSGSMIQGNIENSIIGRDCVIKKGATIKNSVVMSNCVIEAGASITHAILDKAVIVKKNTQIEGNLHAPFVTQKEQILTDQSDIRILFAASEAHPYIKTGGLADVIGGLSKALSNKGVDISVIVPMYKPIKEKYHESYQYITSRTVVFDNDEHKIRLYAITRRKVRYYFIENFEYFERDNIYGYKDDCKRFAFFSLAITVFLDALRPFDLIHMHDWHVGLLPAIMKHYMARPPKTLLTIHNIDYQGKCDSNVLTALNMPKNKQTNINFLESGILNATKLSTVSATYRNELKYDYYGKNLTEPLQKRERDFHGVLNGLPKHFTPANDQVILSKYDKNDYFGKTENKLFLQKKMQLEMGLSKFVIGMVSRITEQKGFPLIIDMLPQVLKHHADIQFVLLGTGDKKLIEKLKAIETEYPTQVKLNLGYDATEPGYIYAGADLFLMPSRVEPCGLAQMIALKYGAIPLVRKTGGLADTITDFDPITKEGNGFTFFTYNKDTLLGRFLDAYHVFKHEKDDWHKLIKSAMKSDFSLETQAQKMLEIYLTTL